MTSFWASSPKIKDLRAWSEEPCSSLDLERKSIAKKPKNISLLDVPVISMFYGVIVAMYFFDRGKHNRPHIHVKYQGEEAVVAIPDGEVIEGSIQKSKMRLVQAWVEIHRDELMADWELAVNGQEVFKIEPLK